MVKQNHQDKINTSRRDFLATAGSMALMAAFPLVPRAAISATHGEQAPAGAKVHRVGIYPAIGISRVGGSDNYFLAPEVPGLPPKPEGGFKDGTEKIKKQAQRFRVYAFDDQDRIIGEITDKHKKTKIEWRVHLANTKAAWYGFNNPLDNGPAAPGLPGQKRNQYFVSDEEREKMLVINGGEKTISGRHTNKHGEDENYAFSGTFWDKQTVKLGKLITDRKGRLIVVPPNGISESPNNTAITSFSDNDGWHDDWCDGPVQASVTFEDGTKMEADTAWISVYRAKFCTGNSACHNLIRRYF